MYGGLILSDDFKFYLLTTTNNDQLAAGTDLPANGSYIYIGDCEKYHHILRFGAIHGSDAPVIEAKQAATASGTPTVLSAASLQHTADPGDDYEYVTWTVETRKHTKGYDFALLDVEGGVTNGTFADAFLIKCENTLPVTQTTSVLPAASQYRFTGGDA